MASITKRELSAVLTASTSGSAMLGEPRRKALQPAAPLNLFTIVSSQL